ncbi:MAG: hypothetical protein ACREIP_05315, partial [Alphaproteobacteria bacterium]
MWQIGGRRPDEAFGTDQFGKIADFIPGHRQKFDGGVFGKQVPRHLLALERIEGAIGKNHHA